MGTLINIRQSHHITVGTTGAIQPPKARIESCEFFSHAQWTCTWTCYILQESARSTLDPCCTLPKREGDDIDRDRESRSLHIIVPNRTDPTGSFTAVHDIGDIDFVYGCVTLPRYEIECLKDPAVGAFRHPLCIRLHNTYSTR